MFPDEWASFSRSKIDKILGFIADPNSKHVTLADIVLMLVLWRYPTPRQEDLTKYSEGLNNVVAEYDLTYDRFMKVPCWLDEWDES